MSRVVRGAVILASAVAWVGSGTAAWAGVVEIDMEVRHLNKGGTETDVGHMWIDGKKLRMESADGEGAMIFRGDQKAMIAIDPKSKTYTRFDEAMAKQVGETISAARKEMDERLKSMPPEQRAMVEKMMAGRMPMAAAEPTAAKDAIQIEETSESLEYDGISCKVVRMLRDGQRQGDLCVASWGDAGVSRSDVAVFSDMGAFYREVLSALGTSSPDIGPAGFEIFDKLDGFPIAGREYKGNTVVRETRFKPKKGSSSGILFEPPPGYTARQPMGPGPRR